MAQKLAPSIAYYPQTDSQSHIANRKVKERIRVLTNYKKDNRNECLVDFEVACDSVVNSTTLCSRFFVNCGIHLRNIQIDNMISNNRSVKSFFMSLEIQLSLLATTLFSNIRKWLNMLISPEAHAVFSQKLGVAINQEPVI